VLVALILVLLSSPAFAQETQITRSTWQFGCGEAASGKRICQMQRDVVAGTGRDIGNNMVMQILITRELGADLNSGISYSVTHKGETSALRRMDYKSCTERGCVAHAPFNEDDIKAFKKGRKIDVFYVSGNLSQVNVSIDLKGFKAVHKQLEKAAK